MGIRFYCDACDRKLNVKAFLAGKKGICPHCGARVLIPAESQIPSSKDNREVAVAPPDMGNGPAASTPGAPAASSENQKAVPVATAVPTAKPVAAPATPPNPDVPTIKDPIAEAPNAIWYVRPPSGGQYGPADGEVMRRWIGEGRVSADSLIWREGWDDWRLSGPEFPELGGEKKTPAAPSPATPSPSASPVSVGSPTNGSPTTTTRSRSRRRSNNGMGVAIIAILGLLVVLLTIIFVFLLVSSGGDSDEGESSLRSARPRIHIVAKMDSTSTPQPSSNDTRL